MDKRVKIALYVVGGIAVFSTAYWAYQKWGKGRGRTSRRSAQATRSAGTAAQAVQYGGEVQGSTSIEDQYTTN